MKINAHTKVSEVIKTSSQAIDTLISVSSKFSKLKNPLLRKIMAPRVTLEQAAKIGGVRIDDLFVALKPLGFEIETMVKNKDEKLTLLPTPSFARDIENSDLITFDVREILASGKDPLNQILEILKKVEEKQTLCIINTFEPTPLIYLLKKKGYESYVNYMDTDEVHTYFHKNITQSSPSKELPKVNIHEEEFYEIMNLYKNNILETDVRNLEMPLPMLTILEQLQNISKEKILFVHHKKVPVHLLPELEERGYEYFIKEICEGDVKLIIRQINE